MFRKPAGAVVIMALLLVASCGGGSSSSSSSNNDTMTLTVDGVPAQYSDAEHTITAYTTDAGANMTVFLGATGFTMTIEFSNTASTSDRPATISAIIGGIAYLGSTTCTITKLATGMGGLVEGAFTSATLSDGLFSTITVSGSFSATRVN